MTILTAQSLSALPADLPVPEDDGAANHLVGLALPPVLLPATMGPAVNPASLRGVTVIYCYPLTGRPGSALPEGWDSIPGARGCTPQSCAFRDHYADLQALRANVFGVSAQTTGYQREAAERLHLPFALLSDAEGRFADALHLPVFEIDGMRLIKRITLITHDATIVKVFYPVFPPDRNAAEVMLWLREHA